jgi:hypothetical protein
VFVAALAIVCGGWFVKNAVVSGNPTYPLLYSVFDGKSWTAEKDRQWNRVHRPHDFSLRALAKDAARVTMTSEWLGPIVVPLAVLAVGRRRDRRLAFALWGLFLWVIACWWLLTHRIDRFWIPTLPLLALLAGLGATWRSDRIWRGVVIALLVFAAGGGFLVSSSIGGGDNRYFVGLDRLRNDPDRLDPWHRDFNEHARGGCVLLVGDAQPFDLEPRALYSTCFDDSPFERIVRDQTADAIRAGFAAEGITHVYVRWDEIERYRRPGNYGFTDFVQPAVFDRLVAEGVLEPLPPIEGQRAQGYRVR